MIDPKSAGPLETDYRSNAKILVGSNRELSVTKAQCFRGEKCPLQYFQQHFFFLFLIFFATEQ